MKLHRLPLRAVALIIALPFSAKAQITWHAAGSVPDSVTAICANIGTGHILAGTASGIYTSADTGKTWTKLGQPGDTHITALSVAGYGKILCGTQSGLFIGNDSGVWTPAISGEWITAITDYGWAGTKQGKLYQPDLALSNWSRVDSVRGFSDKSITAIAHDVTIRQTFAATASSGIMRSLNNGATWDSVYATSDRIVGIGVEFDNSVLVATANSGVLRSKDSGKTWQIFNVGLTDLHTTGLVTWAGRWSLLATRSGVFGFSYFYYNGTLDTVHWINDSYGITGTPNIVAMTLDQSQQLHCALASNHIFSQWTERGFRRVKNTKSPLNFYVTNSGVDFNTGAGSLEGLFWPRGSTDSYIFGGGLWVAAKKHLKNTGEEKLGWSSVGSPLDSIVAIAGNPVTRHFLAISSYGRVYLRSDTGSSWMQLSGIKGTPRNISVLPDGRVMIGTSSGLFVGPEEGPWDTTEVKRSVVAVSHLGVVEAAGYMYTPNANWTHWIKGQKMTVNHITSVNGTGFVAASYLTNLYLSADAGTTWSTVASPGGNSITGIALATDGSIMVTTSANGIFVSSDAGTSWQPHNSGLMSTVALSLKSRNGQDVALLTQDGIYEAASFTSPWVNRTSGLSWNASLSAIDLDDSKGLHAATTDRKIFTTWRSSVLQPGVVELCELGYNPNSGAGWYSPGEIGATESGVDTMWKYFPYLSTSFNAMNGSPTVHDASTPFYRWPMWAQGAADLQRNFNFGTYVSTISQRDALAAAGAKPVTISDEDIVNTYTDRNTSWNPEYVPNTGYPFGLNIHESIYSWGFGRYRDLIFVRYQVTNKSTDTLKECYLAPALDPDIGFPSAGSNERNSALTDSIYRAVGRPLDAYPEYKEFSDNPLSLNMGYQWSNTGAKYGTIGFALVETPVISPITGEPIDNADSLRLGGYGPNSLYQTNKLGLSTFRQWTISNDPSTASLRYEFVSTRGRDIDRGSINDMRALLATGPFTLAPGGSAATTLAIGIAHPSTTSLTANLDSLIRLMASAHKWFASPEIINGDPNNVVIHNFGAASGGNSVSRGLPAMDAALDAYPNPMRGKGMLRVTLPNDETISLELCDEAGRVLQHIQNEKIFSKGEHEIPFIVGDLVNGRYFVRMTSGAQIVAVPIVVER